MKQKYNPLAKEEYHSIKVGDVIERMLGFSIPMYLNVTNVSKTIIECGNWTFSRTTGLEIDEDIPINVSYISKVLTEEEKAIIKNGGKL
jgi:hypothetical protein